MSDDANLASQWNGERILASACKFLTDGDESELAAVLATGALEVQESESSDFFGASQRCLDLYFLAPRALYEILESDDQWDERGAAISRAISAVIPPHLNRGMTYTRAALLDPPQDWRSQYGAERPHAAVEEERPVLEA
jgi:hypothetical protein